MMFGKQNALIDFGKKILALVRGLDLAREGRAAGQENVHRDAAGPQIEQLDLILGRDEGSDAAVTRVDGSNDLGGDVETSAAGRVLDVGAGRFADDFGEAEISKADVVPVVDQDVLELDVAVDDVDVVEVGDGREELLHHLSALDFVEFAAATDGELEQVSLHELHRHVDAVLGGDGFVQSEDVGVTSAAKDFLLMGHHGADLLVVQLVESHDLDGAHLAFSDFGHCGDHSGEGALALLVLFIDFVVVVDVVSRDGRSDWDLGNVRHYSVCVI